MRIDADKTWRAGMSAVDITPDEPIWLSGWGNRTSPSSGVSQRIFVKVLALQFRDDPISILLSSDLMAYSVDFVAAMMQFAEQRFGIERARVVLCATHNHSAPVTTNVLPLYYDLTEQQRTVITRYTSGLCDRFNEAIHLAIEDMTFARIDFGQNVTGFATNRRRSRPDGQSLPQVVDQDVPVLSVRRSSGELRGVVFGYACHTTTVNDGTINGDYAGFAQAELEALHPGTVAMFVAGCGGDAGPNPRWRQGFGALYGHVLAQAVNDVVTDATAIPSEPVCGPLHAAAGIATLSLQPPPDRAALQAMLPGRKGMQLREVQYQIAQLDAGKPLASEYPYPVQVWRFGSGHTFVILSSEVVVDYSLRFKQMYGPESTWVMAYANEHIAYIPSLRVLNEGGYEGTEGMMECGFPCPFSAGVEQTIVDQVETLYSRAEVKHPDARK
jgi:hypothetical protein